MTLNKTIYFLCTLYLQAGDAGQYKAVAKNASGESQATINLTFEDSGPGKPKIPDGIAPRLVGITPILQYSCLGPIGK